MRWCIVLFAACGAAPVSPTHAPPAHTEIAADARPLVDAWAEAIGGRAAIAAAGAIHLRGELTRGGIAGTVDRWESPRGERREETRQQFIATTDVFDGTRGWLIDRNGWVRGIAGFELDEQLALAFVEANAAIVTDRRDGKVTRDGDKLVLAPAGGHRTVTVTFDPVTHLPASTTRRDGEKLRVQTLGDWRSVGGVRVPFAIDEDNGDPNDHVAIRLTTGERGTPPPHAFERPADTSAAPQLAAPVSVPIELVMNGLVFVKVSIDGKPLTFVLDTGAESTVINRSRLAKLGLTATGSFAAGAGGGDVVMGYVPHVTTEVGGARVADQIVSTVPLDALEAPLGRPLDGILGYDFLSRFIVELDYAAKTLRLYDRATYRHSGTGGEVRITLEDGTPYLDAAVEAKAGTPVKGHFVLDTGCLCEVQLSAPFTDEHRLLAAVPDAKAAGYSAGAGGETHEVSGKIRALYVGREVIDSPSADFARDAIGAGADPENAGLIGGLVWNRYRLVLDYRGERVWLDPK